MRTLSHPIRPSVGRLILRFRRGPRSLPSQLHWVRNVRIGSKGEELSVSKCGPVCASVNLGIDRPSALAVMSESHYWLIWRALPAPSASPICGFPTVVLEASPRFHA
jgi:hypothetical protein